MAYFPNFNDPVYGFAAAGYPGVLSGQGGATSMPGSGGILGNSGSSGVLGGGGFSFRNLLDPQYAMPIAAQMIAGRTPQESLAGAVGAIGPAVVDQRRRAALNAWIKAKSGASLAPEDAQLLQQYPDLAAGIVQASMTPHRQFTQIGANILGQPQYGFVDTTTGTITPANADNAAGNGVSGGGMPGAQSGHIYDSLPKAQQATVDAMLKGTMPFPGSFAMKTPYWNTLMAAAAEKDPNFNEANWPVRLQTQKDFASAGKSGQMITAGNTALEHLGHLDEQVDKLGNFDGVPLINYALNAGKNAYQEASGTSGNIKAFNDTKLKYSQELAKFYLAGGGSMGERDEALQQINSASSPTELHQVIRNQLEMIYGKIHALSSAWASAGLPESDLSIVRTPAAKAAIQRIEPELFGGTPAAAPASATHMPAPGVVVPFTEYFR